MLSNVQIRDPNLRVFQTMQRHNNKNASDKASEKYGLHTINNASISTKQSSNNSYHHSSPVINQLSNINKNIKNNINRIQQPSPLSSLQSGVHFNFANIQTKLKVSQPDDVYEKEADRVAERIMRTSAPQENVTSIHTINGEKINCKCQSCQDQEKEEKIIHRKTDDADEYQIPEDVLQSIDNIHGGGFPVDESTREFMESRFGFDFSKVRIHTDEQGAESARAINALAYTVGNDIVFGKGQYNPQMSVGRRLLAHELSHVIQQSKKDTKSTKYFLGEQNHVSEGEVKQGSLSVETVNILYPRVAERRNLMDTSATRRIWRQFVTPIAAGGGFRGLMERERQHIMRPSSSFRVCARDLQGVLGYVGNHSYIEAPPFRYAIISPLCPASKWDNPVTGTTAQKWDNSPDPCGKTPKCVDCLPAPGISDIGQCLRNAFIAYNNPSLYRGTGPNSNTFAGTLARSCCADMVPKPAILGNVPGWNDPPASSRAGALPCPPGPTC